MVVLEPYYSDRDLFVCPSATQPITEGAKYPFAAYPVSEKWTGINENVSYGINGWLRDSFRDNPMYWRNRARIIKASEVPLFMDCKIYVSAPLSKKSESPPPYEGYQYVKPDQQMARVCMNRHEGAINMLFVDGSLRSVGLKELWDLRWHTQWDKSERDPIWPEWMERLSNR